MVREKAKQYSVYTDEDVRGPILASASASVVTQAARRRWRDYLVQESISAFEMAAKTYIIEWIQKSPNPANGKEVLKAKRRAPKGFYAKVEEMVNLEKDEASARFRDDNNLPGESARAGTPSDFLSTLTMQSPVSAASPSATSPMSMAASPSEDIPMLSEDVPEELETEETEDENYAVCTVSFNSVLRKNLNEPIKTIFNTKMNMLVPSASDFVADFQLLVFLTMLSFRNHTFVLDTNQTNFQAAEGFRTQDIFLDNFKMQEHVQHSASPLPRNHDAFDAQIRYLFTSNHLCLLQSEFYGARGMSDASKAKYPLILSLINTIKPQYSSQTTFKKNSLTRECYVSALTTYQTNLSNMWAEKKMFKILLDKLLVVLLRIHLSPSREKKHQEYINTHTDRAKEHQNKKMCIARSSGMRSIDEESATEKQNMEGFIIQKKNREKPKQTTSKDVVAENAPGPSQKRLLEDVGDEERAEGQPAKPLPKPLKIKSSKGKEPMRSPLEESAMAKKVSEEAALPPSPDGYSSVEEVDIIEEEDALRDDDDLTRESLMDERAGLTEHEINVCLPIVIRLKPYIPSKANYESIGHQLPFIILANDLLRCAGYAIFNRNMCPMPSASLEAF
ncbi:hypothetical protein BD560DRAFT_449061 [Blakeslea trispora]|nr:hypothetical protein BD560DRAFT_449061 [Blakeslea trispora]